MFLWYVYYLLNCLFIYLLTLIIIKANHTSYLDYILLSAHKYPHAVVMAKHTGVLG
jgi:hypothetical protein